MGLAVLFIAGLLYALSWRAAGRSALSPARWLRTPLWRRWGPPAAALLYPGYFVAVLLLRDHFDQDRFGISGIAWFLAVVISLPTLLLGVAAALTARSWLVFAGAAAAAIAAPLAFHIFEAGTHGRWYIQSQGLALFLSVAVGAAAWLACMAGATLTWGALARRSRRARGERCCPDCGYDLQGLPIERVTTCPECGAAALQPEVTATTPL